MIYPFNAAEAFKIAISIEENGLEFYQKAAEIIGSGPVADLFRALAEEEKTHKSLFIDFLASVKDQGPTVFDPENETDAYLKMMADLHVFRQKPGAVAEALATVKTAREALKLAINFEKDTVIFFVELKAAVGEQADRLEVDKLIFEEASHIRKLARVYSKQI
ncbi:MAG: ferritin family protein [Deltaproteobacteria bacterium]|jgi:rubrerythrin|nr:ferritin family protein [Deltaproteobacteria bacterium]